MSVRAYQRQKCEEIVFLIVDLVGRRVVFDRISNVDVSRLELSLPPAAVHETLAAARSHSNIAAAPLILSFVCTDVHQSAIVTCRIIETFVVDSS